MRAIRRGLWEHVQVIPLEAGAHEFHRIHLSAQRWPRISPEAGRQISASLIWESLPPVMHLEQLDHASLVYVINLMSLMLGFTSSEGDANCLHVSTLPIPELYGTSLAQGWACVSAFEQLP